MQFAKDFPLGNIDFPDQKFPKGETTLSRTDISRSSPAFQHPPTQSIQEQPQKIRLLGIRTPAGRSSRRREKGRAQTEGRRPVGK